MRSRLLLVLGLSGVWAKSQVVLQGSPARSLSKPPEYRDRLLSLHRSLVEIPSVSGDEGAVAKWLADYLTARGFAAQLQPVPPQDGTPEGRQRYNVLAWPGSASRTAARVLVTSHIDVVPPHIPYAIDGGDVVGDTLIRGRGSVDAKGSVAAQVVAVQNVIEAGRAGASDVMLLFVVGEENLGDGMKAFSANLAALHPPATFGSVIFGEPTENRLACGHKGALFCTIDARGVAGHSGYPWLGKSANELLVRALARVLATDLGSSGRFGNTTVNIGVLEGGVAANVIPASARAAVAFRIAIGPERGAETIIKVKIQDILNSVDPDAFELTCTHGYGVVETNCDVPGFDDITVNYGTDVPNLQGQHVRYLYGPGNILAAHSDHENLTVADLETAVEGYQELILHALKA